VGFWGGKGRFLLIKCSARRFRGKRLGGEPEKGKPRCSRELGGEKAAITMPEKKETEGVGRAHRERKKGGTGNLWEKSAGRRCGEHT